MLTDAFREQKLAIIFVIDKCNNKYIGYIYTTVY